MKNFKIWMRLLTLALIISVAAPVPEICGVSMIATAEAAAKKVSISKSRVTIEKGKSYKLTLRNLKKGSKVKWSSSKRSVASIKAKGSSCVVTAKKGGSATITAKVGKNKYRCKVTVTVKSLPVSLSAKSKTINVGKSFDLSIKNADSVKWSTSNKKIASIKRLSKYKYRITGKKAGNVTITVKVGRKKYKCKVTVKSLPVYLNVKSKVLFKGQSFLLVAKNETATVKASANKNVSLKRVNKTTYKVTAKKEGNSKITVKVGKKKYICNVTIKKKVAPAKPKPSKPTKPSKPITPQTEKPSKPSTPATPSPKPTTEPETEPTTEYKPPVQDKPVETNSEEITETEPETVKPEPIEEVTEKQSETDPVIVVPTPTPTPKPEPTPDPTPKPTPKPEPTPEPITEPSSQPTQPDDGNSDTEDTNSNIPDVVKPTFVVSGGSSLKVKGGERADIIISTALSKESISYKVNNINFKLTVNRVVSRKHFMKNSK